MSETDPEPKVTALNSSFCLTEILFMIIKDRKAANHEVESTSVSDSKCTLLNHHTIFSFDFSLYTRTNRLISDVFQQLTREIASGGPGLCFRGVA